MNKQVLKEVGYKVFVYVAIYICVNLYMKTSSAFEFENWYYIGNIGAASIVYLIVFLGSDSVSYRLKEENQLRDKLDKITITKKGIIGHIIAIILSVSVALILDKV